MKAYLALQKYRFGERLNYDIEVDRECENFKIPKLTIVTFVENACVHGIESKSSPGWIFVRIGPVSYTHLDVYKRQYDSCNPEIYYQMLQLEVEKRVKG